MKFFSTVIIAITLAGFAGTALSETVVNEVPLTWQEVSRLDGAGLYDNLCSACHGAGGKGDGPAASSLDKGVPDLTLFSISNGGAFPHRKVEIMIRGRSRDTSHGTVDMPAWEQQFMALRAGWTGFPQKAFVRNRVHTLAEHIETLQADLDTDKVAAR